MRQINYFFISITIHGILLLLFFLHFSNSEVPERRGRPETPLLSSYIYTATLQENQHVEKQKVVKKEEKKSLSSPQNSLLSLRKRESSQMDSRFRRNDKEAHESERDSSSISEQEQMPAGFRPGEETQTLVALLHDAIQQKQQYPESAAALEREGRVKVSFILNKDGSIGDLRLLSSSGTTSLDNAALNAVREASPFHHLVKYIKEVQIYQIDVVFELT